LPNCPSLVPGSFDIPVACELVHCRRKQNWNVPTPPL